MTYKCTYIHTYIYIYLTYQYLSLFYIYREHTIINNSQTIQMNSNTNTQKQKHMHIHRIQIHIKKCHSKTSQKQRMQIHRIHRIGMMNGWGFALSPPHSMFLFSLFHISKFKPFCYGINGYLPCLVPISVLVSFA